MTTTPKQVESALRDTLIYAAWEYKIAWLGVFDSIFRTNLKSLELVAREMWIKKEMEYFYCRQCGKFMIGENNTLEPFRCNSCVENEYK